MKLNQKKIQKMVKNGERLDGRELDEYREIEIIPDFISETAAGSAKVTIGNTQVVIGLSVSLEEPYSDRPDSGTIVTNAELAPMAHKEYESGPPQEDGVELARVVDRGIREAEAVDLEELCIKSGEKVMTVFIDAHILNDDGSLIDACSLAAMTALMTGTLPKYDEETDTLKRDNREREIPLQEEPVTVTAHKINGEIVWDTTGTEEDAQGSRLTVSINEHGNIVAMQKGETHPFTQQEIMDIVDEAENKTEKLRKQLETATGE
ncbi:MAG: RNA-binding protein [Nanohaloarchaea archaeon SW_7_43_1]|nr:MAG: RNA-binding protein [Nanohaloarchaea archaeon SW_7_43_1]